MPTYVKFDKGAGEKNVFTRFSRWVRWEDRMSLRDPKWDESLTRYPGVYILAHFDTPPSGSADYLSDEVIYVGQTSRFWGRWGAFERSALKGLSGHSGGHAYRETYGVRLWNNLYLAAFPIWFGDGEESLEDWSQMYRLYVERRILWEITVARGGTHGLLNNK